MIPVAKLGKHEIPRVGFGLWQIKDKIELEQAVAAALKAGYRHFDTAQIYGNEAMLGQTLVDCGLARKSLFITTKISVHNFGARRTKRSFQVSLENLQTDYVDLLLLHFPVTGLRKNSWLAIEEIFASGQARAIGVSNFTIKHLEKMKKYARVTPAVNQVELHIFLQQPELRAYCKKEGIVVEAYSPLAHGRGLDNGELAKLAKKYKKSSAQIMLRWCVQVGTIPLPKSVTPARIAQNIDIFDFVIDEPDMKLITSLDENLRTCWDPTLVP